MGDSASHPTPRVRPVADLRLEGLSDVAAELAKAWAVALIVSRPPAAIAEVPLEDLARDGPGLCAQLLGALQSDADLERLTETAEEPERDGPPAATWLASVAGAGDATSVIAAVEALRGVLWEALLGQVRRPVLDRADTQLLSDLADRLSYVCAMVLAAALQATPGRRPRLGRDDDDVLVAGSGGRPPGPRGEPVTPAGPIGRGEVVIIDERQHVPSSARVVVARGTSAAGETRDAGEPASRVPRTEAQPAEAEGASWREPEVPQMTSPAPATRAMPDHEPSEADGDPRGDPRLGAPSEIQIRDERIEEGPAAWIRSIGRELERFALDGRPFAVLLIELLDAERLKPSEPAEEFSRLAGQVQRTLESELWTLSERAGASLTREAPGRFWLLAPGMEALRVRALAEQIEHAVRRSVIHHGEPVEIVVGTAVCPADGVQAAALAAHADVALYAARSARSAGDGAAG